ncbi:MAG: deoxyribodipyrimidine photo-lyase [Myxococcales bacterium]|nr:deoxyribodipyrimidine photo-lyase [Myxococcales bacterium]
MRTLVWFRGKDLRIADHAPLHDAIAGGEVVPVFVLDPYFFSPKRAARLPNRMQYLLASLAALAANIAHKGSRLLLVSGKSVETIPRLAKQLRADRVVAHRWVEPFARERDARVKAALGDRFTLYEGETLITPGTLRTGGGTPYSVYTPFARAARAKLGPLSAIPAPRKLPALPSDLDVVEAKLPDLASLGLAPNPRLIEPGEKAARARLKRFLEHGLADYEAERDRMDHDGTSRLSADLKFGTLSVREVVVGLGAAVEADRSKESGAEKFMNELLWREFTHHTLWDRPGLLDHPFRPDFEGFPYRHDAAGLAAWKAGKTGYPIVDAAQRQLLAEGYVHNRARMVTASFLTKHLLVSYKEGEAHFLEHLVDGDWAQNNAGWQWSAGCGCDAQPYFRVMNPVAQGEKFDPDGAYVRRWVPELAKLDAKHIHAPWLAPPMELAEAGITLGKTYPTPIVEHKHARQRFLDVAKSHLGRARP